MSTRARQIQRRGRRSARLWDRVAEVVITMGGMAVLAAVLGICVYLLWVVVPLFQSGSASDSGDMTTAAPVVDSAEDVVELWMDSDQRLAALLDATGLVTVTDLGTGRVIDDIVAIESPTALALLPSARAGVAGLADGSVRFFDVGFESSLVDEAALSALREALTGIDQLGPSERDAVAALVASPGVFDRLGQSPVRLGSLDAESFRIDAESLVGVEAPASLSSLPIGVEDLVAVSEQIAGSRLRGELLTQLSSDFDAADRVAFAAELLQGLADSAGGPAAGRFATLAARYNAALDVSELGLAQRSASGRDGSDDRAFAAVGRAMDLASALQGAGRSFDVEAVEFERWIADAAVRKAALERVSSLAMLGEGNGKAVPIVRRPGGIVPALDRSVDEAGDVGLAWRSERGDITLSAFAVDREPAASSSGRGPARRVGVSASPDGRRFVAVVWGDGSATLATRTLIRPLDGSAPRPRLDAREIELAASDRGLPDHAFVTGTGEDVLLLWSDGTLERYGVDGSTLAMMESLSLGGSVATARMVPGAQTLAVGLEDGSLESVTVAADPVAAAADARRIVRRDGRFPLGAIPEAITASLRDRLIAIAEAGGGVEVVHATSRKRVAAFESNASEPVALAVGPRNDGVLVLDRSGAFDLWRMTPGFPEASVGTLFGRVLYEGETQPRFVYQSSGGEEGGEPKLSITPLIFGTLKATVFAMLFAAPIAVLAAIYSSEFLHPRIRKTVKPTIELMASLPSVVLGFVAAIVVAPFVRDALPAVLVSLVVVPMTVMVVAALWQLVPEHASRRMTSGRQLLCVGVLLAVGLGLSAVLGPAIERGLFSPSRADQLVLAGSVEPVATPPAWFGSRDAVGPSEMLRLRRDGLAFQSGLVVRSVEPSPNASERIEREIKERSLGEASIRQWLGGAYGGPFPGWLCVLILPSALVVWLVRARVVDRRAADRLALMTATSAGVFEIARLLTTLALTIAVAAGAAAVLSAMGLDPRESILGPFSVRNTLVVGIIMGFAIIPIIYTISEDALRSVPESLRLASLGAGASRWQTAIRIALPVAASGIFSACMIGLGRAVGETMIVLMATGNTPEMSWNIFSGFRTLAANIAVELAVASTSTWSPPGGTHYRVLFLCGLALFAMTFVINTTAELVRQRYRKRSRAL